MTRSEDSLPLVALPGSGPSAGTSATSTAALETLANRLRAACGGERRAPCRHECCMTLGALTGRRPAWPLSHGHGESRPVVHFGFKACCGDGALGASTAPGRPRRSTASGALALALRQARSMPVRAPLRPMQASKAGARARAEGPWAGTFNACYGYRRPLRRPGLQLASARRPSRRARGQNATSGNHVADQHARTGLMHPALPFPPDLSRWHDRVFRFARPPVALAPQVGHGCEVPQDRRGSQKPSRVHGNLKGVTSAPLR